MKFSKCETVNINPDPLMCQPKYPQQSLDQIYQPDEPQKLDITFLITCVGLMFLLALVGFGGYWALTKRDHHHNMNSIEIYKSRERFLTIFICGYGLLTAIIIFFIFYLVIPKS